MPHVIGSLLRPPAGAQIPARRFCSDNLLIPLPRCFVPVPHSLSCRLNQTGGRVGPTGGTTLLSLLWGYKHTPTGFPEYRSSPGVRSRLLHWAVVPAGDLSVLMTQPLEPLVPRRHPVDLSGIELSVTNGCMEVLGSLCWRFWARYVVDSFLSTVSCPGQWPNQMDG